MNTNSFLRKPWIFLIIMVVFSIVLWFVTYYLVGPGTSETSQNQMLIELSKVLAQLVFITLAGATATFLYNQYAKAQERHKNKLEEALKNRRELLDALIRVRAEVEKVRRNYRMFQPQNRTEGYRQTIGGLLRARLELSQVWHDMLTLQQLFQEQEHENILNGLTGMKKYLDNLINEYEQKMEKINELEDEDLAEYLANLDFGKFVKGEGDKKYTQEFLEQNYRKSCAIMRQQILSPEE